VDSVQNDGKDPRGVRILVKTQFGQVSALAALFAIMQVFFISVKTLIISDLWRDTVGHI
jgi:hypothetical protein